jgi:hypothetical protein
MRRLPLLLLLVGLGLAAATVFAAPGQPNDFVIVNADGSRTLSVVPSVDLGSVMAAVGARFVLTYANENRAYDLIAVPAPLQTRIEQVLDRFVILYANERRARTLAYPVALVNDTTAPQAGNISVNVASATTAIVSWTTNEYTTSTVEYGPAPGSYVHTTESTIYYKQHQAVLSNLVSGSTYYFRIIDTDQSNNVGQSTERSFLLTSPLFLPLVAR